MRQVLIVGLGGAAGSILRYLLQRWLNTDGFFWGTLAVNLAGCFLIGVVWNLLVRGLSPDIGLFLTTGLCGGFTTMSAFSFESNLLLQNGRAGTAFLYMGATILGCLLATFAGYKTSI